MKTGPSITELARAIAQEIIDTWECQNGPAIKQDFEEIFYGKQGSVSFGFEIWTGMGFRTSYTLVQKQGGKILSTY